MMVGSIWCYFLPPFLFFPWAVYLLDLLQGLPPCPRSLSLYSSSLPDLSLDPNLLSGDLLGVSLYLFLFSIGVLGDLSLVSGILDCSCGDLSLLASL
ncbi:hypothetical protein FKM82_019730 [Ascaphus truei]